MNITCCYRVTPQSEAIFTTIDSETHVAKFMPRHFYNAEDLILPEYAPSSYNGVSADFEAMCEAILLSDKNNAIVVECATIGYYVLQWDGYWRFVKGPLDDSDKGRNILIPHPGNFKSIGYRKTQLRQFRACAGVYRLTYDMVTGKIITNNGELTPEFDVDTLSAIDYNYKGYKDIVTQGAYAVVYLDGNPVLLDKTVDDKLIMRL